MLSLYKEKSIDELSRIIGKERCQIISKGRRLKIIFMDMWTEEQDDFLRKKYLTMSYQEIATVINRSRSTVQGRCRKLGLIKSYSSSKKDVKF